MRNSDYSSPGKGLLHGRAVMLNGRVLVIKTDFIYIYTVHVHSPRNLPVSQKEGEG